MDLLYLDTNCFQREFDDILQQKVFLEAVACRNIFQAAKAQTVKLVWSFMHENEVTYCPKPDRTNKIVQLSSLCSVEIAPSENIYTIAKEIGLFGLSPNDAAHIACAIISKAGYFITCDMNIIKRMKKHKRTGLLVINPVEYGY